MNWKTKEWHSFNQRKENKMKSYKHSLRDFWDIIIKWTRKIQKIPNKYQIM